MAKAPANGDVNLPDIMRTEQQRLTTRRDELQAELNTVTQQLDGIDRYFNIPTAKPEKKTRTPPGRRAPKGSVQTSVLEVIQKASPDGIAPKAIRAALNGIGDQSVSNALANLKKGGKIAAQTDGRYTATA